MASFTILLPASEGKQPGGNPYAPDMFDYRASNTFNYFSDLNPDRRALITALHEAIEQGEGLEKLFGIKGDYLKQAIEANLKIYNSPLMAALDRYSPGVLYQAMDFASLPTGAQRRLLEHGIIFSGLFGLLRPDDLIPNYRLRMDASLPGIGKVSRFWRTRLSDILNRTVADKFVWNLLPAAHREAWEDTHTYKQMIEVRFYRQKNGVRKPVTHGVKPLRGALANFIVRVAADSVEALEDWRHPEGFRIDPEASSWNEETRSGVVVMVASA